MVSFFADLGTVFILGLLTPLTAVCVLPLYPGFLSYLSHKLSGKEEHKSTIILFGMLVVLGVITFMGIVGLLFTAFLKISLTKVIGIVSPIAFTLLGIISLFLIFNINIGKYIPKMVVPQSDNPLISAFLFGFFFGAIVIPCNPLFIAALFTSSLSSTTNFIGGIIQFIAFGVGIGTPLLIFTVISATASGKIIGFLTKHQRIINLFSGIFMIIVTLYYLICVFSLFGDSSISMTTCVSLNTLFGTVMGVV